ncbi:unnamed protein product [Onchocerca flexuosa]|uniref:WD_REPEATS_REGION domain-containing protein n=1 Tax=Onchocerca flexuosa TaxID=387005 RepID=A0A183HJI6_9BILA|nr:unnamed protein product [Onchocerca flexuosa]
MSWNPSSPSIFLIFNSGSWQVFQLVDLNRSVVYFSDEQICDGKLLSDKRSAIAYANGSRSAHMVFCMSAPHVICRADTESNIVLWEIDEVLPIESENKVIAKQPKLTTNMECQWNGLKNLPPSIYDSEDNCEITATHYISSQGRFLIGCGDGTIILMYGCDAISKQLLTTNEGVICFCLLNKI